MARKTDFPKRVQIVSGEDVNSSDWANIIETYIRANWMHVFESFAYDVESYEFDPMAIGLIFCSAKRLDVMSVDPGGQHQFIFIFSKINDRYVYTLYSRYEKIVNGESTIDYNKIHEEDSFCMSDSITQMLKTAYNNFCC